MSFYQTSLANTKKESERERERERKEERKKERKKCSGFNDETHSLLIYYSQIPV